MPPFAKGGAYCFAHVGWSVGLYVSHINSGTIIFLSFDQGAGGIKIKFQYLLLTSHHIFNAQKWINMFRDPVSLQHTLKQTRGQCDIISEKADNIKKRLLLRCIHHFKSDLINNMDHMSISGNKTLCRIKLEYWQSQEGPRRALCKFAGAMLKFLKSSSKVTVTHSKFLVPLERSCHKEHTCQIWKLYLIW